MGMFCSSTSSTSAGQSCIDRNIIIRTVVIFPA
jgi:hypothetical protein